MEGGCARCAGCGLACAGAANRGILANCYGIPARIRENSADTAGADPVSTDADEVLVIEGGRIVERGTHASLLEQKGVYYGLYQRQFRKDENGAVATAG
ncbi:MAG: Lipid A export ATP-binding/permease protein MsbA [Chloroflexi bacterium ADurb.Bin180]|nr:MAG: Lipid A export ATP-binding/permease protein MsbA [Chloroflexi bacterium ADurb.Bin180]